MHTGRTKEVATIPCEVIIDGDRLGEYAISVDHAPSRVANQANSPTWLNWSSLASEVTTSFSRSFKLAEYA
jgi:hypothetical protein